MDLPRPPEGKHGNGTLGGGCCGGSPMVDVARLFTSRRFVTDGGLTMGTVVESRLLGSARGGSAELRGEGFLLPTKPTRSFETDMLVGRRSIAGAALLLSIAISLKAVIDCDPIVASRACVGVMDMRIDVRCEEFHDVYPLVAGEIDALLDAYRGSGPPLVKTDVLRDDRAESSSLNPAFNGEVLPACSGIGEVEWISFDIRFELRGDSDRLLVSGTDASANALGLAPCCNWGDPPDAAR